MEPTAERSPDREAARTFEEEYLYGEATATVEALLESLGVSRTELAARLGVSKGRVSQMLSGEENITLRSLAGLGWALGVRFEFHPTPLRDRASSPAAQDPPLPQWMSRLSIRPVPHYRPVPESPDPVPRWRRSTFKASQLISAVP